MHLFQTNTMVHQQQVTACMLTCQCALQLQSCSYHAAATCSCCATSPTHQNTKPQYNTGARPNPTKLLAMMGSPLLCASRYCATVSLNTLSSRAEDIYHSNLQHDTAGRVCTGRVKPQCGRSLHDHSTASTTTGVWHTVP